MKPEHYAKAIILLLVGVALLQAEAPAQTPADQLTGSLKGVIVGLYGNPVGGASVIVENKNIKREVTADDEGNFKVELPDGTYRITVKSPGLKAYRKKLKFQRDETKTLKIVLQSPASANIENCPRGFTCL
jgi:hypothetical protein